MSIITREDVVKMAKISNIEIKPHEVESMMKQLSDVLSYAQRVQEIAADMEVPSNKNTDVVREDVIIRKEREAYLSLAPEREGDYFVVPKILENV